MPISLTAQRATAACPPARRCCPHCLAPVDQVEGGDATRCATCRLVVGAGRSITPEAAATSGRSASTAANLISAQARRDRKEPAADPLLAAADVRRVAAALGVAADRVRMLDYQAASEADPELAPLGGLIATFGSWKAARRAALSHTTQAT